VLQAVQRGQGRKAADGLDRDNLSRFLSRILTRSRMSKSLEQIYEDIQGHIDDPGPYSHNLISINLTIIANNHGKAAANKAIRDLGLDELGWQEQPE
jgi:hypothetical protein